MFYHVIIAIKQNTCSVILANYFTYSEKLIIPKRLFVKNCPRTNYASVDIFSSIKWQEKIQTTSIKGWCNTNRTEIKQTTKYKGVESVNNGLKNSGQPTTAAQVSL